MAVSGNYLVVGAPADNHGSIQNTDYGAAYIFELINGTWTEISKLRASDILPFDNYGRNVAINDTLVVVSNSPHPSVGERENSTVYVYALRNHRWVEQVILMARDASPNARFGESLAIEGKYLLVGAPGYTSKANNSGAVFQFKRQGENWIELGFVTGEDTSPDDAFGSSISVDGQFVLIGAPDKRDIPFQGGAAYLFAQEGDVWHEYVKRSV